MQFNKVIDKPTRQPFSCVWSQHLSSPLYCHSFHQYLRRWRTLVDTNICKYICTSYKIHMWLQCCVCKCPDSFTLFWLLSCSVLTFKWRRKKKEKKSYQNLTPDLKLVELVWSVRRCRFFFIYHLRFVSFCFMFILFF